MTQKSEEGLVFPQPPKDRNDFPLTTQSDDDDDAMSGEEEKKEEEVRLLFYAHRRTRGRGDERNRD